MVLYLCCTNNNKGESTMKTKNGIKELSVEELSERWVWLIKTGFNKLEVTEQFPKRGLNKFTVTDLTLEFENEFVMCKDEKEILIEQISPLMMFLRDGLKSVYLLPIGNDLYQEQLIFRDGIVLIEKLNKIK